MSEDRRIEITIAAFFVGQFTVHTAIVATSSYNPPDIVIGIINICIAGAAYYFTGNELRHQRQD